MKLQNANALPRDLLGACPAFVQAIGRGDLEAAAACFAREGCLITPDATAIHGRERIRHVLAQMVIRRTSVLVETSSSIRTGEVVLARERWRIRSGEDEDRPIEQTLDAVLALRRVEDTWKLEIAAPWGWGGRAL